jgi:hypothetical protein
MYMKGYIPPASARSDGEQWEEQQGGRRVSFVRHTHRSPQKAVRNTTASGRNILGYPIGRKGSAERTFDAPSLFISSWEGRDVAVLEFCQESFLLFLWSRVHFLQ